MLSRKERRKLEERRKKNRVLKKQLSAASTLAVLLPHASVLTNADTHSEAVIRQEDGYGEERYARIQLENAIATANASIGGGRYSQHLIDTLGLPGLTGRAQILLTNTEATLAEIREKTSELERVLHELSTQASEEEVVEETVVEEDSSTNEEETGYDDKEYEAGYEGDDVDNEAEVDKEYESTPAPIPPQPETKPETAPTPEATPPVEQVPPTTTVPENQPEQSQPTTPEAPNETATHTVAPGETLYGIARLHGVTLEQLLAWNNIGDGRLIFPGQVLIIGEAVSAAAGYGQEQEILENHQTNTQVITTTAGNSAGVAEVFQSQSIASSNLNGFELPILMTLDNDNQGAFISESLRLLGSPYRLEEDEQPESDIVAAQEAGQVDSAEESATEEDEREPKQPFNNIELPIHIYEQVFGIQLGETMEDLLNAGHRVEQSEEADFVIGDLLFWEEETGEIERVAVYLGQNRYIMATENLDIQQNFEDEEPAGVRIFTLPEQDEEAEEEYLTEIEEEGAPSFAVRPTPAYIEFADLELTEHGEQLLASYAATHDFRVNPQTEAFIEQIGEDARDLGLRYDLFASVMIAQAILESGSGSSTLSASPHYNLFGIKGSYQGSSVTMPTYEDDGTGYWYMIDAAFRSYPSFRASLEDYVQLIRGGILGNEYFYRQVWRSEAENYLQATYYLTGRYATDTQYYNKLNSIIAAYNLTRFDMPIETEVGELADVRTDIPESFRDLMVFEPFDNVNRNLSGSYPVGQCTWFVYNRIAQLGGSIGAFMGNGGDWGRTGVALGYQVSRTPQAGDAVSFAPGVAGADGTFGHVAFVEAVGTDGILISEQNVIGLGITSYRFIPNHIAVSSGVIYITPRR